MFTRSGIKGVAKSSMRFLREWIVAGMRLRAQGDMLYVPEDDTHNQAGGANEDETRSTGVSRSQRARPRQYSDDEQDTEI